VSGLVLPDRLRLRYEKLGRIRFTSQRDVARVLERALRRAHLPLKRSAGFSPRPLISFGLALPTGCASLAEYLDLRLDEEADTEAVDVVGFERADPASLRELAERLSGLLPQGLRVTAAAALDGTEFSLQEAVTSCDWELEVLGLSPAELSGRLERLLDADVVMVARERKGRTVTDDIRPNLRSLEAHDRPLRTIEGLGDVAGLRAATATRPRGVRPAELLRAIGEDVTLLGACRTAQWIESEDRTVREEPLSVAGTLANGRPLAAEARER
jgi:radical SAM-linked protein